MVCNKGGFTKENPPVKYKGYTDHMECFRADFIKKFTKKHTHIYLDDLEDVKDVMSLPKLNAAWAALLEIKDGEDDGERESIILHSDYKTKLEDALVDVFMKNSGARVLGIFRKGNAIAYKTIMTIHIVEEKETT